MSCPQIRLAQTAYVLPTEYTAVGSFCVQRFLLAFFSLQLYCLCLFIQLIWTMHLLLAGAAICSCVIVIIVVAFCYYYLAIICWQCPSIGYFFTFVYKQNSAVPHKNRAKSRTTNIYELLEWPAIWGRCERQGEWQCHWHAVFSFFVYFQSRAESKLCQHKYIHKYLHIQTGIYDII